jgi:hypothetical protein
LISLTSAIVLEWKSMNPNVNYEISHQITVTFREHLGDFAD